LPGDSLDAHVDWGTDPVVFADGGTMRFAQNVSHTGVIAAPLAGLMPDTQYHFRHRVEDPVAMTATTSTVARAFTTLGAVTFPSFFALNEDTVLRAQCTVSHYGVAPVSLKFWLGTAPNNLAEIKMFNSVASGGTCHAEAACEIGTLYYYQFTAEYVYNNKTYAYASAVKQYRALSPSAVKTLYWGGGSGDIPNGTPLATTAAALTGTWSATAKNWSVDEFGSQYVAWRGGNDATAYLRIRGTGSAVITLATAPELNRFTVDMQTTSGNTGFQLAAGAANTVTLAGDRPAINILQGGSAENSHLNINSGVQLVAANGFTKTGGGRINIHSQANSVAGTLNIEGNQGVMVHEGGSLLGVRLFNLSGSGTLFHRIGNGAQNHFHNDAVVRMAHNAVITPDASSNSSTGHDSFRQIYLDAHGQLLNLGQNRGILHLNDKDYGIHRGPYTNATLYLQGGTAGTPAQEVLLPLVVVSNGVPANVVLPWVYTERSNPVMLDPATKGFKEIIPVAAPTDARLWTNTANLQRLRVEAALSNSLTNNLQLETLGFYSPTANTTLNIAPGCTLDITSGHLTANLNHAYITGGEITSSSGKLYATARTWERNLYLNTKVTGPIDFIKSGQAPVIFKGLDSNDYTGTTYVNNGSLIIGKGLITSPATVYPAGTLVSIPGDLVINSGGVVEFEVWNTPSVQVIHTNANILIRDNGRLYFQQNTIQDFNGVFRLENGIYQYRQATANGWQRFRHAGPGPGVVFANGGRFQYLHPDPHSVFLLTNLRCEPGASNQVTLVSDEKHIQIGLSLTHNASPNPASPLPMAAREIEVGKAALLPPGVPEMSVSMQMETAPHAKAELRKTGGGTLALERVSGLFEGRATVLDGALLLNNYATQSTHYVQGTHYAQKLVGFTSTAGIHPGQLINYLRPYNNSNGRTYGWASIVRANEIEIPQWPQGVSGPNGTLGDYTATFFACGPLGFADIVVKDSGLLGGTGGHTGNILISTGGVFRTGTPLKRISDFILGGNPNFPQLSACNLTFTHGATWQVDVAGPTSPLAAGVTRVDGNIVLNGKCELMYEGLKRPKGVFTIATYGGTVAGKMAAPQGCSVRVNQTAKTIELHSSEAGTLFLVR